MEECGTKLEEKEEASLVPLRKSSRIKENVRTSKKSDGLWEEEYRDVPDIIKEASSCGRLKDTYKKELVLGTGGFAKVYRVVETSTGIVYADKIICTEIFQRKSNAKDKVDREVLIHKNLDHHNIVKFYKFFLDGNFIHMMMEICINRTLLHVLKYRKTITEPEARYYIKQIFEGTRYLHLKQVLHRDLKLGNMFLHRDMSLKIGDFGLASTFQSNKPGSVCGTPNYIAPEVLSKKGHGVTSDIWAIGCMLYAMLCGSPPFETQSINATYRKITSCSFIIPTRFQVSTPASELIEMMLAPLPEKRGHLAMPGKDEDCDLFLQPFFREFTPATLPSSAVRSTPNLEAERCRAMDAGNLTRSSAMSITGRRMTNEDPGCSSFSPIFSPSSLKQKFGSFFDKKIRFSQRVVEGLSLCVQQGERLLGFREPTVQTQVPVFVSKWVDYSNKFGFGYQLSNNAVGLLFNDSTKIGCSGDRLTVEFFDQKGKCFTFPFRGPVKYNNQDLRARASVLESIINYMETNLNDAGAPLQGKTGLCSTQKSLIPQLKHWSRGSGELVMELSNSTIQINHLEKHTKVIVCETGGDLHLTLLNPNNTVNTYSLSSLLSHGTPVTTLAWIQASLPALRKLAERE